MVIEVKILATCGGYSILPEKGHKESSKVLEMYGGYRCKVHWALLLRFCDLLYVIPQ